ncbi:MAG: outer membrane beta-barrel protein, partial [Xanthobacteraceae bacterium]
MTRFWAGGIALIVVAVAGGSAWAADMAVKASPMTAPAAHDWSGFRVGLIGGGGWGSARQTDSLPFDSGSYDIDGGLIGATWSQSWQSGQLVYGFESDIVYSSIEGSTPGTVGTCGGAPPNCASELQWPGTTRVRLGWAWDRYMPFVTAGLATATIHGEEGTTPAAGAVGSGSGWVAGWTAGGGIEAAINDKWTAKIDYLYMDFGNEHVFDDLFAGAVLAEHIDMQAHV